MSFLVVASMCLLGFVFYSIIHDRRLLRTRSQLLVADLARNGAFESERHRLLADRELMRTDINRLREEIRIHQRGIQYAQRALQDLTVMRPAREGPSPTNPDVVIDESILEGVIAELQTDKQKLETLINGPEPEDRDSIEYLNYLACRVIYEKRYLSPESKLDLLLKEDS